MAAQETYGTSMEQERGQGPYEKAQQLGTEAYHQTSEALGQAYDKTADVVSGAYNQAVGYGRENPATMTLVAFGIGVGVGLLLAGTLSPSRGRSFTEPIVNAISDLARDVLR
jgi:ElaB/YqjD/DUF883 family membrane-anchored ribosome-binding protein